MTDQAPDDFGPEGHGIADTDVDLSGDTVGSGDGADDTALDDLDGSDVDLPAPVATAVLTHIVRSIVDDPGAVRVDGLEGSRRVKLEVRVGDGDLGRVIGRRGRTAQSIRTVVRAAATRDGVDVDVDFAD